MVKGVCPIKTHIPRPRSGRTKGSGSIVFSIKVYIPGSIGGFDTQAAGLSSEAKRSVSKPTQPKPDRCGGSQGLPLPKMLGLFLKTT